MQTFLPNGTDMIFFKPSYRYFRFNINDKKNSGQSSVGLHLYRPKNDKRYKTRHFLN